MASIDDYLKAKVNQFTSSFSKRPLVGGLVGQGVKYAQSPQVQNVVRQQLAPTIQSVRMVAPVAKAYGNIIGQGITSWQKTTPHGHAFQQLSQNLPQSSPNKYANTYLKAIAPFRKPTNFEDVGNIASAAWGAPQVGANLIGGGIGYGINKFTKGESDADAFQHGIEFSSKVGGINKLLATPLAPLVQKLNPKAAQSIGKLMDKGLTKQAFSQLWRNVRTAATTGAIEGAAFGSVLPAKDAKQWVKNTFDNATQFATFSGGITGVGGLSTIGGKYVWKNGGRLVRTAENALNSRLGGGKAQNVQEANAIMSPTNILISHEGAPDRARVDFYKKKILNGEKIDPIVIVNEGAKYGIEDGKHRFQAYKELGYKDVPVIFKGGEEYQQMMARAESNIKLPKQLPKELEGVAKEVQLSEKPYNFKYTSDELPQAGKTITYKGKDVGGIGYGKDLNGTDTWLYNIEIDPQYRNKGIGKKAIEQFFQTSRANKVNGYAESPAAAKFFKSIGARVDAEGNFTLNKTDFNQAKGVQEADLSFKIPESKGVKKLVAKNNKQVVDQVTLPVSKPRGFTESVKEAPNVKPNVKQGVTASYKVKPNSKLMGEAEALLHEGAKLNFSNVKDADRKVAATIQEAINQQRKNPQAAANLFNNLSEQGTELGRGVQAFSLLKKMTPESIALSAAGKIKRYNMTATRKIPELTGDQVSLIAKRVDALNRLKVGSREHNIAVNELYKTINEFIPSSIGDKAIAVWKAGLLTSLRTHERNLIGNTLHQGAEIVKDIPANLADRLMSARTGQRTTTLTVRGLKEGGSKGLQAAKDIIKSGYDPEQAISKYDVRQVTWGKNPAEQGLKKYTDIVFRTLGAADKPFWNAAYARSLYDQAGAQAINVGKGKNAKYIESLVKKPTEEMLLTAAREANVATFHDKNVLSSVVNAAKQQLSKSEYTKVAGEVLAPFTGVPSSIAGQMVAYSPVGLIKGALKVGKVLTQNIPELQRQAAQEVGRGVVGAGLWGLGAYLVSKGLMTGQPKDTKEADQWQIEGKQANSVLIDGKWRSINSIGPEFLILLAGAKFQQEMSKGEDANVGSYLAGVGKDFMSQTFLQGVQGPLNALNDPQRFGKSYVGGQISSVIPNIVKDTSKALDPFQRETNSVSDYVKNSIPGVRNQSVPKRDVLGNELSQEPTGINAYIDLFNSKTPIKNSVVDELSRLNTGGFNATPSKLNKTQTIQGEKTVLTPEQLDSLEKFRGPILSKALEQLFQSSSYQAKSDQDKADAVDTVVKKINKYIRGEGGAPTFNSGETAKPLDTQEVIKPKTIKTKTSKTPKTKTLKASKARKPKKVKALKLKKVPMAKFKKFKTPKLASKQIKYAKIKKPKKYRLDLKSLAVKV